MDKGERIPRVACSVARLLRQFNSGGMDDVRERQCGGGVERQSVDLQQSSLIDKHEYLRCQVW